MAFTTAAPGGHTTIAHNAALSFGVPRAAYRTNNRIGKRNMRHPDAQVSVTPPSQVLIWQGYCP
jgi:Na+/alanine symporter